VEIVDCVVLLVSISVTEGVTLVILLEDDDDEVGLVVWTVVNVDKVDSDSEIVPSSAEVAVISLVLMVSKIKKIVMYLSQ
jgi:hypothetical protein